MRARLHIGILGGLLLLGLPADLRPLEQADEYEVKAGFLVNFPSFVEWPADSFPSPTAPVNICVLGRNPFGKTLESLAGGKAVGARTLRVRQLSDVRQATGCDILFVSSSERLRFRFILDAVKDAPVFTVGDSSDFIAQGGVANLWMEKGKIRVEINAEAAKAKNLRISSRLMAVAKPERP